MQTFRAKLPKINFNDDKELKKRKALIETLGENYKDGWVYGKPIMSQKGEPALFDYNKSNKSPSIFKFIAIVDKATTSINLNLTDATGKEVFEYDIIQFKDLNLFKKRIAGVVFRDRITNKLKYGEWNEKSHCFVEVKNPKEYLSRSDFIIIGNLIDTPNILKSKDDE